MRKYEFNHESEINELAKVARVRGYKVRKGEFLTEDPNKGLIYKLLGDDEVWAWFDANGTARFEKVAL